MARQAVFIIEGTEFPCSISKLDRDKLYGWKEVKAFDQGGRECIKGSIDPGGGICIPPGGKALGLLDSKGRWVDRSSLKAVDKITGAPAVLVPGIYDQPITLGAKMGVNDFMDYAIEYIYLVESEAAAELAQALKDPDNFFTFTYNYRADYEGSPAFLVENNGKVFILAGFKADIHYCTPDETSLLDAASPETESEEIDFGMI